MRKLDRTNFAFVGFATIIGLAIRIATPLASSFPLNDGGLFYKMIVDIQTNQFVLPAFTTYNIDSIPFAYPPLAFYVYAFINTYVHIPVLDLMRILPAIVSSAAIPAFYLLAKEILESKTQVFLATIIFALTPRAFDWLIMGGGVTRSLGLLFAILAMRQAYILFTAPSVKSAATMVGFGALVVYTHPEATTHTALAASFFYLWKDRSSKGFFLSLLTALGILIATAPWWTVILSRHGFDPFFAAMDAARQDSYNTIAGLFALFQFEFTDEPFLTVISVLALIGIFSLLAKREYLLPLWLLIMNIVEPRGGPLFMMIPIAMAASIGLDEIILPRLYILNRRQIQSPEPEASLVQTDFDQLIKSQIARLFIGFLFVYGMMSAYAITLRIQQQFTLTDSDLQAFNWVKNNTSAADKFVLITGGVPLRDSTSEWFPALTERRSLATVFGFEWIRDEMFGEHTLDYRALQLCISQNTNCLDEWSQKSGLAFNYVYLRSPDGNNADNIPLAIYLRNSSDYRMVYDSDAVKIFQKK